MARQSNLKLRGNLLKKYCLENLIDRNNKCKISLRDFMKTSWKDIGGAYKSIGTMQQWLYKFDEIKNSEPYRGEHVTEKLTYRFAIDEGYWTEDEVPFENFTNNTMIIKSKIDENKLIEMNEIDILGFVQSNLFSANRRKEVLIISCGDEKYYEQVNNDNKKKMLGVLNNG